MFVPGCCSRPRWLNASFSHQCLSPEAAVWSMEQNSGSQCFLSPSADLEILTPLLKVTAGYFGLEECVYGFFVKFCYYSYYSQKGIFLLFSRVGKISGV